MWVRTRRILDNQDLILARLRRIERLLGLIEQRETAMALNLDTLTTEVGENSDVVASAIDLIQRIASEIGSNSGDQAAVDALAAQLSSSADALAAAVVANTPAEAVEPPAEPAP